MASLKHHHYHLEFQFSLCNLTKKTSGIICELILVWHQTSHSCLHIKILNCQWRQVYNGWNTTSAVPCMEEVGWHFLRSTWEGLWKEVENMLHICPPRLPAPPHMWSRHIWTESWWASGASPLFLCVSLYNGNIKSTERCQNTTRESWNKRTP